MKFVLFTDLDGTLLDPSDYSYDVALPVLGALKREDVPVVFCTAKTLAESEYYREELGIKDPFIVENGGAIFIPHGYFSFEFSHTVEMGDYSVIELGARYEELRRALEEIRAETGLKIIGFGDMSVDELVEEAKLSREKAKLAKDKLYNESFIFDESEDKEAILIEKVEEKGFSLTHGGRYYNIHGRGASKGKAVRILTELFREEYGAVKTIGIGDSRNDIPMLEAVEQPAVVKRRDGTWLELPSALRNLYKAKGEGPEGWIEVVEKFILGLS